MEETFFYAVLSLVFLLLAFKLLLPYKRKSNLPPGPTSLPIIGHLHLLKQPLHRTFQMFSEKHGHVISFKFGSQRVVIVSSPAAVQECFTKNDVILANRPKSLAGKYVAYDDKTMGTAPYGEHWRNLRRIGAIEIFSTSRLNAFSEIRKDEVERLLRKLSDNSHNEFSKVELQSLFTKLTFNIVIRMAAGKRYYGDDVADEEEASRFRDIMDRVSSLLQSVHPVDVFPILRWIDPTGYERKLEKVGKRKDEFMQGLIDEHRRRKEDWRNSMIDHLLSLQTSEPEYYSDQIIKGFVQDIIFAGTDTTSIALEWAMSNLLNNPDVLEKARAELDCKVGERLVNEPDLLNLPYLGGVISETLRLYPPASLGVPHFSSDDSTIGGYDLPRRTMVLVNIWAIQRDPELWDEPTKFKPERYEAEMGDEMTYKFIPFGFGRRACPGSGLAQRVLGLALGSLIQCFEWKRVGEEEVDMAHGTNVFLRRRTPLEAMCKARPIMDKLCS